MIKRSVGVRLSDMLAAIDGALEIVQDRTFNDYQSNFMVQKAIERCVEIVSEASRHLPEELKKKHPNAYWQEIKAVGNILRHEYHRIDDLVMWRIVKNYFPELRRVVKDLLDTVD
jgi:uncharacterized protein with HEPN domain